MNPIANRPDSGALPGRAAVFLVLLALAPASAQSPAELVDFFSTDDPHYSILDRMGLSPCAGANAREVAEREALRKLSAYGPVALPALELALDSFARDAKRLMAEPAWPALRAALQSSRGWRYRGRACASVAVRFPRSEGMRVQPESLAALLQALPRCGGA